MSAYAKNHIRWADVPKEPLNRLLERQYVSGDQTTVAQIHLRQGCVVPTHQHPNEQISTILSGKLRFTFDPDGEAEEFTLCSGEVLVIPANVPHMAEALEDTLNLDFFSPRREDWISGADAYLREGSASK